MSRLSKRVSVLLRELRAKLRPLGEAPPDGAGLLFATGFDKSGTTWLMRTLDMHPEVVCRGCGQFFDLHHPEVHFLRSSGGFALLADEPAESSWMRSSGHVWLEADELRSTAAALVASSLERYRGSEVRWVGDKSTKQDLERIFSAFPAARVTVIHRDGRDVAVSLAYHFARRGTSEKFESDGALQDRHIDDAAHAWSIYVDHVEGYREDERVYSLRYEDLLSDPVAELERLFAHLGVDTSRSLREEIAEQTSFEAMSGGRAAGTEDRTSFFRKGVANDWMNHLSEAQNDRFVEIAEGALERLGYRLRP